MSPQRGRAVASAAEPLAALLTVPTGVVESAWARRGAIRPHRCRNVHIGAGMPSRPYQRAASLTTPHHSADLDRGEDCGASLQDGNRQARSGGDGGGQMPPLLHRLGGGWLRTSPRSSGVVRARGARSEAFSGPAAPMRPCPHGRVARTAKYRCVAPCVCRDATMPPDLSGVDTPRTRSIALGQRLGQLSVSTFADLGSFCAVRPSSERVGKRRRRVASVFHSGTSIRVARPVEHFRSDAGGARRSP